MENSLLLYCLEDETASFIWEFNGSIISPQNAALILELDSFSHFHGCKCGEKLDR